MSPPRKRLARADLEILPPAVDHEGGLARVSAELRIGKRSERLWYRFPESHLPHLSSNSDPFLLASLFLAMQQGRNIKVHGAVSQSLLNNLEGYQTTWNQWEPKRYHKVSISSDRIASPTAPDQEHVAVMFSGGLDSCHLIWKHALSPDARTMTKPQSALFVHGFDIPLEKISIYEGYYTKAKEVTDSVGIELIELHSNFRQITGDWVYSHGLALASCLHLFGGLFTTGLIASSHAYESPRLPWGSNPVTDPMLSSDQLTLINDGGECHRWDKARLVADWPTGMKHLRVCYEREGLGKNCGRCDNCLFTALCFIASGKVPPPALTHESTLEIITRIRSQAIEPIGALRIEELLAYARDLGTTGPWIKELESARQFHIKRHRLAMPLGKLMLWLENLKMKTMHHR